MPRAKSCEVTGRGGEVFHMSPERRVNVYVRPSGLTVGIAAAASGTSVTALLKLVEAGYETSWRVYARSSPNAVVSYSAWGSAAAERSDLPSIFRVPPMTGVPEPFWLALNHGTVDVLKL